MSTRQIRIYHQPSRLLLWLPNPLLPFVAFRVALDGNHPEVEVVREPDPLPTRTC